MINGVPESGWYVIRTKPHMEDRALWHLRNQGFDVYLPKYRKQVRTARKTQSVLRPLFPGYIFARPSEKISAWRSINGTVGVLALIQFGAEPALLSNEFLADIKLREDEAGAVSLAPAKLVKGDMVKVNDGAFAESYAVLEEMIDEKRAILLIELLGREVRVSAPVESLLKVS